MWKWSDDSFEIGDGVLDMRMSKKGNYGTTFLG